MNKLGYNRPDDVGELVSYEYDDETGMTTEVFSSTEGMGNLVGRYHEDVGLVTWFREEV